MPEMIVGRPLHELELADEHGPEPLALGHLRLGQALPPSPAARFGQVDEGALLGPLETNHHTVERMGRPDAMMRPWKVFLLHD